MDKLAVDSRDKFVVDSQERVVVETMDKLLVDVSGDKKGGRGEKFPPR